MQRTITTALVGAGLLGAAALVSDAVALPGPGAGSALDQPVSAVEQVSRRRSRYRDRLRPFRRSANRYRDSLRPLRRSRYRYPARLRPLRHRPGYRATLRPQPRYRVRDRLKRLRLSGAEREKRLQAQAARERAARRAFARQQQERRQRDEAMRRFQEVERRVQETWGR
jgi:hypothetical protein